MFALFSTKIKDKKIDNSSRKKSSMNFSINKIALPWWLTSSTFSISWTLLFAFPIRKVEIGFNTTHKNLMILPGRWTCSFISMLGWPAPTTKNHGWHPTLLLAGTLPLPQYQPLWWPLAIAKGVKTSLPWLSFTVAVWHAISLAFLHKTTWLDDLGTMWLVLHCLWLYNC